MLGGHNFEDPGSTQLTSASHNHPSTPNTFNNDCADEFEELGATSLEDNANDPNDEFDEGIGHLNAVERCIQTFCVMWRNERSSPLLLPHSFALQEEFTRLLEAQDRFLQQPSPTSSQSNPNSSFIGGVGADEDVDDHFAKHMGLLELERLQYMLSNYVKTRMRKMEERAQWLLGHEIEYLNRMLSPPELTYLTEYKTHI